MYKNILSVLLISLFMQLNAQPTVKKIKVLPVPAFGFTPETKTYVGAVSLFTLRMYNDTITRTSNAKIKAIYTWNKQFIAEGEWNYFFKEEKWFTKGQISFSYYPDDYFGIGNNTPDQNKLVFTTNRFVAEEFILKKINRKLFAGMSFSYYDYSKLKTEIENPYPELAASTTQGYGAAIVYDSRNNLLTATKGAYLFLNPTFNISKENFWKIVLDGRYYKTWQGAYTLAWHFYNEYNVGTIPFYKNAVMGGDKTVRGFFYGRFRDQCLSSLQSECRLPVCKRIAVAAFGGYSVLYARPDKINLTNGKYNFGAGIRFLMDKKEKTNLRFDYAIGQGKNNGFYIAFGESF
jgi:outer membrane protein assembly factor BamA